MKKMLVLAIEMGTVIDHIPSKESLKIIKLLNICQIENRITIGVNLLSQKLGKKDLIKIENVQLSEKEAQLIALFASSASINLIENYKVVKKYKNKLPETISSILVCPNKSCITNFEKISTHFQVEQNDAAVELHCKYCQKKFLKGAIKEFRN